MVEEEAMRKSREMRPESQDAGFEQKPVVEQKESQAESREDASRDGEQRDEAEQQAEPVQVKMPTAAEAVPTVAPVKDPVLVDIENLLSDDLTDLFLALPDEKKWEFKQKGEETASKIQEMVQGGKLKVKKIFDLIRDWLKIVPGVNKFFLEQEAKIKADKIMHYAEEQRKASQNQV